MSKSYITCHMLQFLVFFSSWWDSLNFSVPPIVHRIPDSILWIKVYCPTNGRVTTLEPLAYGTVSCQLVLLNPTLTVGLGQGGQEVIPGRVDV